MEYTEVMESREMFNRLDGTDSTTARREFIGYLQTASQKIESDKASAPKVAYSIAGMFATDFAHNLDENDPLTEIMTIAGELEINPNDVEELRRELVRKICEL
jgi:hypothetical protein